VVLVHPIPAWHPWKDRHVSLSRTDGCPKRADKYGTGRHDGVTDNLDKAPTFIAGLPVAETAEIQAEIAALRAVVRVAQLVPSAT